MLEITALLLLQVAVVTAWVIERRRRRAAELESRRLFLDLTHADRALTASAMSASLAHELNQPLGAIQTNVETAQIILNAIPLDQGELKEILEDIQSSCTRAADIITQLRSLLRKQDAAKLSTFDLNDAIKDALSMVEPTARQGGVMLDFTPAMARLSVRAQPIHLKQVILNLAINGVQAMDGVPPGRRKLTFHTNAMDASKAEVSVYDTGPGIPDANLEDVFQTFYTTKQLGMGLGLSIVRTIVETYGGKIWAENRSDGGAVFRFTLPLAKVEKK